MSAADEIQVIRQHVVDLLLQASAEGEARRLSKVPINPASYYGCVTKACQQIDLVIRIRWAAAGMRPNLPLARAAEGVQLLALAVTGANNQATPEWLEVLGGRATALRTQRERVGS